MRWRISFHVIKLYNKQTIHVLKMSSAIFLHEIKARYKWEIINATPKLYNINLDPSLQNVQICPTKCSNLWKMNYVILLKYSIMDELFLLWRTLNILEVFQLTEWRLLLRFGNQVSWKSRKISWKFVWPVRTCYIGVIKDKIA